MEFLTTVAYLAGGMALGLLVEMPLYSAVTEARETYTIALQKMNRAGL